VIERWEIEDIPGFGRVSADRVLAAVAAHPAAEDAISRLLSRLRSLEATLNEDQAARRIARLEAERNELEARLSESGVRALELERRRLAERVAWCEASADSRPGSSTPLCPGARSKVAALSAARQQLKRLQDREAQGGSVVYFMDFGETVKIGRTVNLPRRVAQLGPRSVLAQVRGGSALETELHARFRHLHSPIPGEGGTEHFRKTPELMRFIASIENDYAASAA